ncbi:hypothetical protein [Gaiella sp.]|uniref:hypothetical protein n=1 Tax=Gaiella sp. TaxID=2663207 RepID=UPI0032675526
MVRVYGVHVTDEDGRHLVALLLAEGSADALEATERIVDGIKRGRCFTVALTVSQREAVLRVLAEPPAGLDELHRKLRCDLVSRASSDTRW